MKAVDRSSLHIESENVQSERSFIRFTLGQRWEHVLLILSFSILLLTGLPQKYYANWGYRILTTPEVLNLVRLIHRTAAVVLTLEAVYHLGSAIRSIVRRNLSSAIFISTQDLRDAWQVFKHLIFLTEEKPRFGKFNFEQKLTYWLIFVGAGIMVITGFLLWFPELFTKVFPGGIIPAAKLAHSHESIVALVFLVIWHIYHVHLERLNLSIFTGRLKEQDMREYHPLEFERLTGESLGHQGENKSNLVPGEDE
jgi:formate dehydrogenase gamma subunit